MELENCTNYDAGANLPANKTRRTIECFVLKEKWRVKCELAIVIGLVIIVWGLLSLPILFYHLDGSQVKHFQLCYIIAFAYVYTSVKRKFFSAESICH